MIKTYHSKVTFMELEKELEECITSSLCCVFESLNGKPQCIKWK